MRKDNGRMVSPRKNGTWGQKLNDAQRVSGVYPTQQAAIDAAKQMLQKSGGGELSVQGRDGKIRSKDTIAPGNDPYPPKDKEH